MNVRKAPGRPGKYAAYDNLLRALPKVMEKRPKYVNGIGLFRGQRGVTVWTKVMLRKGGMYRGRSYAPGQSMEIKLGALESWSWQELEAERDRLQGLADRNEPLEPAPTVLFSAHAQEWLDRKEGLIKSWSETAGYVRNHLNPAFGKKALGDITHADVAKWQAQQLRLHKPASVQRQLSALRSILNDAVKLGLIERSPTQRVDPIKGAQARHRWLSDDELTAVFKAADKIEAEAAAREKYNDHTIKGWLKDFVLFALHSGMRRQEMLNLRMEHFETLGDATFVLVATSKNGSARRVACTPDMLAIRDRMAALKQRQKGDDRLFPISLSTAKRTLTKLWKVSGLGDVRLHDFRRTHVTQLVHSNVDLVTVAGRVGHKDLKMLERVYAVFIGDKHAADKADAAFSKFG